VGVAVFLVQNTKPELKIYCMCVTTHGLVYYAKYSLGILYFNKRNLETWNKKKKKINKK
jgi:hypothetical protein